MTDGEFVTCYLAVDAQPDAATLTSGVVDQG
jgi:hypothetical protein